MPSRPLGTMVAYGFPKGDVAVDLAIASKLNASCLEILPDWQNLPDPISLRPRVDDLDLTIHSAHGCWGSQSIHAARVDLADLDETTRLASIDDLKRCVDWLNSAGGTCLVVHPGGLSDEAIFDRRRAALAESLLALADHAKGTPIVLCVENMPPGVHPGSRMSDLFSLVAELARPELALALDTGHANLNATAEVETRAAGRLLRTTHVHDNNGRQDSHEPPGQGTVDWEAWRSALDAIGYEGPIMLECIRRLRQEPGAIDDALCERLANLRMIRGE